MIYTPAQLQSRATDFLKLWALQDNGAMVLIFTLMQRTGASIETCLERIANFSKWKP